MNKEDMIGKLQQTILAIESLDEDKVESLHNNTFASNSIDYLNEIMFTGTGRSTYTMKKVIECITEDMFDKDVLILYYCKNYHESKYHMDNLIKILSPLLKIIVSRSSMSIGIGNIRIDFVTKGEHHARKWHGLRYDKVVIFEDHNVYDCNYDWYHSKHHPRFSEKTLNHSLFEMWQKGDWGI